MSPKSLFGNGSDKTIEIYTKKGDSPGTQIMLGTSNTQNTKTRKSKQVLTENAFTEQSTVVGLKNSVSSFKKWNPQGLTFIDVEMNRHTKLNNSGPSINQHWNINSSNKSKDCNFFK